MDKYMAAYLTEEYEKVLVLEREQHGRFYLQLEEAETVVGLRREWVLRREGSFPAFETVAGYRDNKAELLRRIRLYDSLHYKIRCAVVVATGKLLNAARSFYRRIYNTQFLRDVRCEANGDPWRHIWK